MNGREYEAVMLQISSRVKIVFPGHKGMGDGPVIGPNQSLANRNTVEDGFGEDEREEDTEIKDVP